jgi:hypothetical protein
LTAWEGKLQRREIARLRQETMELKEQVERDTGKPIQLTAEERHLLAKQAEGIDPETIKKISVFDIEDLSPAKPQTDSAEPR